jgi:hypothetical protein
MNKIRVILFSFSTLFVSASIQAVPPVPTGLFYLPSGRSLSDAALNNQNVDGVVVGASWSDLKPTELGPYVFDHAANGQSLDQLVAAVEAVGKPMRLSINTGGPGVSGDGPKTIRGSKPDWLITKIANDSYTGDKFFTYVDSKTPQGENITAKIPVFWEPTLLAQHTALVQAVANHLAGHPLIKIVFVPYANADTNDWNLGDTSDNMADGIPPNGSTPQDRWLHAINHSGYATMEAALIAAGNATFSAYHTAFPNKILTTSIGRLQNDELNPGGSGVYGRNISETVVNNAAEAWPGYIVAQKNNLNGGGVPDAPGPEDSAWHDLYLLNVPHAAQMVWHAYDDCEETMDQWSAERMNMGNGSDCMDSTQMLYQAVHTGITYETKWQELYELDILNLGNMNADPHLPAGVPRNVIGYAHQHLF